MGIKTRATKEKAHITWDRKFKMWSAEYYLRDYGFQDVKHFDIYAVFRDLYEAYVWTNRLAG